MKYLVISKQAERREEMKSLLRQLDRRAHTQEAWDWVQANTALNRDQRDLVFADLSGPDAQKEACAMLLQRPNQLLAVLTDALDAQTTLRLVRSGMRAVIPRDLDWRAVIRALELVLLGEYYVPKNALHLGTDRSAKLLRPSVGEARLPYRRRLIDATVLSPRQQQIMRLVHMGSTNKGIARALGISEGTVKIHLATVFKLLGATNRAAAVAIYNGWLFEQAGTAQTIRTSHDTMMSASAATADSTHHVVETAASRPLRSLRSDGPSSDGAMLLAAEGETSAYYEARSDETMQNEIPAKALAEMPVTFGKKPLSGVSDDDDLPFGTIGPLLSTR